MYFSHLASGQKSSGCSAGGLLTSFFGRQATHPSAHGSESAQVLLQALVGLLVQPRHGPELGPVEAAVTGVEDHAEGGHHTVEVGLLPPRPPEEEHDVTVRHPPDSEAADGVAPGGGVPSL